MKKLNKIVISIIFLFMLINLPLSAMMDNSGKYRDKMGNITINKETILDEDAYLFGRTILIDGKAEYGVNSCGRKIIVNGVINEELMALSQILEINGEVKDNVKAAAQEININGIIGRNVMGCSTDLMLSKKAKINGSLKAFCSSAIIDGVIGKNLRLKAKDIKISGIINGDANLCSNNIIFSSAVINGNLKYESSTELIIPKDTKIKGKVEWVRHNYSSAERKTIAASFIAFIIGILFVIRIALFIGMIIIAIIIIKISSRQVIVITDAMRTSFLKSIGTGVLVVIIIPLISLILLFTLIGIPVSIFLIFALMIIWYVSKIFVGLFIGKAILDFFRKDGKSSLILSFIIGIILFKLITWIPVIGCLLGMLAAVWAIGAFVITRYALYKELKEKEII